MRLRSFLYKRGWRQSTSLPATVISVGNLTMGGTGKTPMVMYLARYFQDKGMRPVVLSRGYGGGARETVNVVSDGKEIFLGPEECGDEPRLIAESLPGVPVLTGKKRARTGHVALEKFGADVVLLDDGFQHLALERDLDIVLFSANHYLGNRRVFPGGDLREPVTALKRAHIFAITGVTGETKARAETFRDHLQRDYPDKPVFLGHYRPACLIVGGESRPISLEEAREQSFFAFCGLATPTSFLNTLRQESLKIVGFRPFPDHCPYRERDIREIEKEAAATGATAIITTEKDFVKLVNGAWRLPLMALRVDLHFEEDFDRHLRRFLDSIRAGKASA